MQFQRYAGLRIQRVSHRNAPPPYFFFMTVSYRILSTEYFYIDAFHVSVQLLGTQTRRVDPFLGCVE